MLRKKEILIKIVFCLILLFIVLSNTSIVRASEGDSLLSSILGDIESFKGVADNSGVEIDANEVTESFVGLGQILTMIGTGVMIAVTTFMGIKYLTAGPEAQAKLKLQLIGLVVSGIVIFGAYYIWKLVIIIVSSVE